MQSASAERAAPKGHWHFRRAHLSVELVVLAAALLTALACYHRDDLTSSEVSLGPEDVGTLVEGYQYDDHGNGGASLVASQAGRPLAWDCDLSRAYVYGYCGFGVTLGNLNSGRGIDLRGFDHVTIALRYEGSGNSLRLALKTKDAAYTALGAPTDEKVNQANVRVARGAQTVEIGLDQFAVAEWWRQSAARPSAKLEEPEFHNVMAVELMTGAEAPAGRHSVRIEKIGFHGRVVSAEAWYGGIAFAWLLLIGSILFLRRRESASWKGKLLESIRTTVDTIPHMVWALDATGKTYFNRRWDAFTGVSLGTSGGLDLRRLIHPADIRAAVEDWRAGIQSGQEFDIELRIRPHSGDYRWMLAHAVPSRDEAGEITGWHGTCTDVHDRVLAQEALRGSIRKERRRSQQLKWTSDHDALTRLPNRRAFEARLADVTLRAPGSASEVGLLIVDMDYFKHVNDTLGHGAGDELLRSMATRLKRSVRRNDFVARIGGDEFAVVLPNLQQESDLSALGNQVAAAIQLPLKIAGHVVRPSASIGGAICPKDKSDADEFLKRADAALYALKRSGRGGFRLFESYMLDEVKSAAFQLERARQAIADDSIIPVYQPKVSIRGGALVGFEALLRYTSPEGTLGLPDTLAEAFSDYELAASIGAVMQRRVACDIRTWIDRGLSFGRVSINAAPAEFLRDDYAERLLRVLDAHDVPPDCIEVEVTEHAFVERGREYVARALDLLKAAGVMLSLDDFGTGHSSLSHMRDFPVDLIKVDRSYTRQISEDEEIAALVAGVVHLACSLGLEVVAEGVETSRQFDLLRAMGCHFAQGHLLGKPVESARVHEYISQDMLRKSAA